LGRFFIFFVKALAYKEETIKQTPKQNIKKLIIKTSSDLKPLLMKNLYPKVHPVQS